MADAHRRESTDPVEKVTAKQKITGGNRDVVLYQRIQQIRRCDTLVDAAAHRARIGAIRRRALIVDERYVRKRQLDSRRKRRNQALEALGMKGVVGIDQGHDVAARQRHSAIERGVGASVGLRGQSHRERDSPGELGNDLRAAIAGPVVDDDQLIWRARLRTDRSQRLRQIPRMVVERHHERNVVAARS